jgi:hypothetical protein
MMGTLTPYKFWAVKGVGNFLVVWTISSCMARVNVNLYTQTLGSATQL